MFFYWFYIKMRPDFVFSYWLFLAFLFYYFGVLPYNPKYFLIFALVVNIFELFLFTHFGLSRDRLILFVIINFFIKVIPIYLLWKRRVKERDNFFFAGLFVFYLLWLFANGVDLKKEADTFMKNPRPTAPLSDLIMKK